MSSPSSDSSSSKRKDYQFPDLEIELSEKINALEGSAFIKLNWTSVLDSAWVFGSLKCESSGQVFLLLKSSDLVWHDLQEAYGNTIESLVATEIEKPKKVKPVLMLKKWCSLNVAQEFRCFVLKKTLVVICQRHVRYFFKHLAEQAIQNEMVDQITAFFKTYGTF